MGAATSSTTLSSLGTCTIPAGTMQPGDRVKIDFDYSHEGSLTGFTFAVNWGNTLLVAAQWSRQRRVRFRVGRSRRQHVRLPVVGAELGYRAGPRRRRAERIRLAVVPIVLAFQGQMAATTTDTVTLRNFSVVRYPATQ
jgi:hypothetical protein